MEELIINLIEEVKEGREYPLKALALLRDYSKQIASAITEIEPMAFGEASGFSEKSFKAHGFKYEVKEGARRFDFKGIDEWSALSKQIKEKEALYKMAASAYERGQAMFDEDTGEKIPVPKVSYSKASISVTKDNSSE